MTDRVRGAARTLGHLGIGAASAVLGLLPWLLTGMRLPSQSLAAEAAAPGEGPIVLLPFSPYALTLVVALLVVGSGIAGVVARATRRRPRLALPALVAGVLVVQLAALLQTAVVVPGVLRRSESTGLYVWGLVAIAVAAILGGLLVLLLLAKAPAAGAIVAVALASVTLASWLAGLVSPFGVAARDPDLELLAAVRWAPAVVTGLAVVWWGVGTFGRLVAALGALLVLWVVPALFTGASAAVGSRVLADRPAEMLEYGAGVFLGALREPAASLSLVLLAAGVMVLGLALRWSLRGTRWAIPDSNR